MGAGQAPCFLFCSPRSANDFSNYGFRVDLQGWGNSVTTAGYGGLPGSSNDANALYTGSFGGTSSASPIVAGAAAALQGVAIARMGRPLPPLEVRDRLVTTGTPQQGAKHIGPLPNLRAAIAAIPTLPFKRYLPIAVRN